MELLVTMILTVFSGILILWGNQVYSIAMEEKIKRQRIIMYIIAILAMVTALSVMGVVYAF